MKELKSIKKKENRIFCFSKVYLIKVINKSVEKKENKLK